MRALLLQEAMHCCSMLGCNSLSEPVKVNSLVYGYCRVEPLAKHCFYDAVFAALAIITGTNNTQRK